MTPQRDIERVLERWLDDGINEMPDMVYLSILDRVERQPQQRAWRVSWRDSHVSTYIKPLIAVAAVVLVAVASIAIIGRPSGSGVGGAASQAASPAPSPSPTASAMPSAASPASAVFPPWYTGDRDGAGILPAGSQTTRFFMPGSTVTVPEGWVNNLDVPIAYGLFPDTPANEAEYALSGETAQGIFMVSVESPYFLCEAWEESHGTAAERVASLVASEALAVSEPIDVTIGGLTGKQIDVRLDPGWTETCPGDPPELDLGDKRYRVTYLDTPDGGVIAIAVGSSHSTGHEAFLAQTMPIIESFQFDLNP